MSTVTGSGLGCPEAPSFVVSEVRMSRWNIDRRSSAGLRASALLSGAAALVALSLSACGGGAPTRAPDNEISPIEVPGDGAVAAENIADALERIAGERGAAVVPNPGIGAPAVPAGAFLTITGWPASGLVEVNDSQTMVYTAGPGFTGYDEFEYTVTYADGATSVAVVRVMVPQLQVVDGD